MKTTIFSSVSCKFFAALTIVMLALAGLPVMPAFAATLTVTTNADVVAINAACSLREAIANANNDAATNVDCAAGTGADIIQFSAAVTTITLVAALPTITDVDSLTIDGGSDVTVDGGGAFRIFQIINGATIFQNITLSNGQVDGNGGAIFNNGGTDLTISNVTFTSNRTVIGGGNDGGAIYHTSGTLNILNSTFTSNYTQDNGGAIYIAAGTGTMTISGSSFTTQNNAAIDAGAAIYLNAGTLTINSATFTSNSTTNGSGGAIFQNGGTLTIDAAAFSGNTASGNGGAINVSAVGGGTLTVNNTTFTNSNAANSADAGGAIYHNSATLLTVTNSTFTGNTATVAGGDGGAIMLDNNGSSATISGSAFTSNSANDAGGAIFNDGEPFTVTTSAFTSNSAGTGAASAGNGGAIHNSINSLSAASKITLSSFINNSIAMAADFSALGGAISNSGTIIIANVTFSGNSLTKSTAGAGNSFGGGLYADGTTTVHNATFSGNTVSESGTGTGSGGSIYSVAGAVTIANSIVANGTENGAAGNCGGTYTNGGNNVDFNGGDCGFAITTDPNLGALTGSPQYFPLTTGSSAIDTGSNAICATATSTNNESQNGLTRPLDGNGDATLTCDIGSYEGPTVSATTTTITADTPDPSVTGETVAVTVTVTGGATPTGTVDITGADVNCSITLVAGTGSCNVTFTSVGAKTLTATYNGDATHTTSSDTEPHTVNQASTTTTITSDLPDPSAAGQSVTVNYSVAVTGPGAGTPTGNVTVSDGVDSCIGTVAAGTCNITLTTQGARTLTAAYAGDTDFAGSTSAGESHYVNGAPTDISLSASSIAENNAINDVIGALSATDPDVGDTFTFSLACTIPGADDGSFNISGANLQAGAVFDFETQNSYAICIRVTDSANNTFDKNFTITVLDINETPTDIALSATSIAENNAINDVIGALTTTDPDAGNTFTYGLTCATPGVDDASFNVSGANLQAGAVFDFETQNSYAICIRTTDQGGLFFDKNLTITVTNVNETPTDIALSATSIAENNAINDVIGALSTTDPDAGNTFTYTLACAAPGADDASFNISGANLQAGAVFDFETQNSYAICIRTTDQGGLFFDKNFTISITDVDEIPPDTSIDSTTPSTTPTNITTMDITFSSNEGGSTFQCQLDVAAYAPCTSPVNLVGLSDGSHTFSVYATDPTGNDDPTPASYTWIIDTTPPDTTIDTNPTDPSNDSTPTFTFSSADLSATFECRIDAGVFSACASPATFGPLADGLHTFEVRAVDPLGNTDATPASYTWTIDTTPPDTTIDTSPVSPSSDSTPTFSFSSADLSATFECRIDAGVFSVCASPATFGPLADGLHTFEVRAIDTAGNIDPTPATYTWTIDTGIPSLTSFTRQTPVASPTNADIVVFRATFSEAVQNVDVADFAVNGTTTAAVTNVTPVTASAYDVTVSGGDLAGFNGVVGLDLSGAQDIADLSGNPIPAGEPAIDETYTLDNTLPSVDTILRANADPTSAASVDFTVTFTENVTGVDTIDFTLTTTGVSGATITGISGSGLSYTVTVNTGTGNGTIRLDLVFNGTVHDLAGNDLDGPHVGDEFYTIDKSGPSITIASTATNPTAVSPIPVTFTFSEPVTGFVLGDITVGNGTAGNFAGSGAVYTADITPTAVGSVTVDVTAAVAIDGSGNSNTAATQFSIIYDTTNPTVITTSLIAVYTSTGPGSFTVTFSKNVADPAGNAGTDDATNPANYLLVNKGVNGVADTLSCIGGIVTDDTQVTVTGVSYNNVTFTSTVTLAGALPIGSYRLFVCGTTSIVDLAGNPLNGGTDYTFDFVVQAAPRAAIATLPATGFPQNDMTTLPLQPVEKAYASTDLWLEIPKLGVKMSIIGVPKTKDGWDVTWLNKDAGWLNGSAFPTWSGNSVITGHVWDALNKPGPFAGLKDLKYGDQFVIHAFGQVYTYAITESILVSPSSTTTVFKHEDKSAITLITCEEYRESSQTYSYRRMVRAALVSVGKEK